MNTCETYLTKEGILALRSVEDGADKLIIEEFKVSSVDYNFDDTYTDIESYYRAGVSGYVYTDDKIEFIIDIPPEYARDRAKFFAVYLSDGTPFIYAKPYGMLHANKRQKITIQITWNNIRPLLNLKNIPYAAAGKSIISEKGLHALTDTTLKVQKLPLKYFKVSDKDYPLNRQLTDIDSWYEADIAAYLPIDDNTIEFVIDIPPEKALFEGKSFALYLEDGTLFMLANPPAPFPPLFRQTFRIQFVYKNAESAFDFKYIPFSEEEGALSILDAAADYGNQTIKIWEHMAGLDQKTSFGLDKRNNLNEVDPVKARDNLNVYSRQEISEKLKGITGVEVSPVDNVDKVDGRDVDDNQTNEQVLWTGAKIDSTINVRLDSYFQKNMVYCAYFKKRPGDKIKTGTLIKIDEEGYAAHPKAGEAFIGVSIDPEEINDDTRLILAADDRSENGYFVMVAMTGFITIKCVEDVKPGEYITAGIYRGVGRTAMASKGMTGLKRLIAVKSLDVIGSIKPMDKTFQPITVEVTHEPESEDIIPAELKRADVAGIIKNLGSDKELIEEFKRLYIVEGPGPRKLFIPPADLDDETRKKILSIFKETGYSFGNVKKDPVTKEIVIPRILSIADFQKLLGNFKIFDKEQAQIRRYLKDTYHLENMQRVLSNEVDDDDMEYLQQIFGSIDFTYAKVEPKEDLIKEIKIKKVLALLM